MIRDLHFDVSDKNFPNEVILDVPHLKFPLELDLRDDIGLIDVARMIRHAFDGGLEKAEPR